MLNLNFFSDLSDELFLGHSISDYISNASSELSLGALEMFESQEKHFFPLTLFMFLQKIHTILSEILKHDMLFYL